MDRQESKLGIYNELRQKLINNEDLSDKEWDTYFQLDEESRQGGEQWEKCFSDSIIHERQSFKNKHTGQEAVVPVKKASVIPRIIYAGSLMTTAVIAAVLFYPSSLPVHQASRTAGGRNAAGRTEQTVRTVAQENAKSPVAAAENRVSDESLYKINPYLEACIDDNMRSLSVTLTITSPQPAAVLEAPVRSVNFSGTAGLPEKSGDMEFRLKVYSNDKSAYLDDKALASASIIIKNTKDNANFSESISAKFSKGLYYYTFEDKESGRMLKAGKFIIK